MLEDKSDTKLPKLTREQIMIGIGALLVLGALIPSIYFYTQYRKAQSRLDNPTQFAKDEALKLTTAVGKLMTIPSDETPTVATVNDVAKLKNQPFFANAKNGDKVLIYTNAKKAILYRPDINKIIDVAPVNLGNSIASPSAQAVGSATPTLAPVTFMLLNGTSTVGLTKRYETELKQKVKNAEVVDRDNAKKLSYEKTILVDVAGSRAAQAAQLARDLGISVSTLPEGEATPASQFLIIIGLDKK